MWLKILVAVCFVFFQLAYIDLQINSLLTHVTAPEKEVSIMFSLIGQIMKLKSQLQCRVYVVAIMPLHACVGLIVLMKGSYTDFALGDIPFNCLILSSCGVLLC